MGVAGESQTHHHPHEEEKPSDLCAACIESYVYQQGQSYVYQHRKKYIVKKKTVLDTVWSPVDHTCFKNKARQKQAETSKSCLHFTCFCSVLRGFKKNRLLLLLLLLLLVLVLLLLLLLLASFGTCKNRATSSTRTETRTTTNANITTKTHTHTHKQRRSKARKRTAKT